LRFSCEDQQGYRILRINCMNLSTVLQSGKTCGIAAILTIWKNKLFAVLHAQFFISVGNSRKYDGRQSD